MRKVSELPYKMEYKRFIDPKTKRKAHGFLIHGTDQDGKKLATVVKSGKNKSKTKSACEREFFKRNKDRKL